MSLHSTPSLLMTRLIVKATGRASEPLPREGAASDFTLRKQGDRAEFFLEEQVPGVRDHAPQCELGTIIKTPHLWSILQVTVSVTHIG